MTIAYSSNCSTRPGSKVGPFRHPLHRKSSQPCRPAKASARLGLQPQWNAFSRPTAFTSKPPAQTGDRSRNLRGDRYPQGVCGPPLGLRPQGTTTPQERIKTLTTALLMSASSGSSMSACCALQSPDQPSGLRGLRKPWRLPNSLSNAFRAHHAPFEASS
jgi:hypothetical protein